jgi:hypothetical protein
MNRKASFKTGLGSGEDATDRHAKRELKTLLEKRRMRTRAASTTACNDQPIPFAQLMTRDYDKKKLGIDPRMLHVLTELLRVATNEDIEQHANELLFIDGKPQVLVFLVERASQADKAALSCIINLTGAVTTHAVPVAAVLIGHGFLAAAERLLGHSGGPCELDVWRIMVNLMGICPESRDAVLASSIPLAKALTEVGGEDVKSLYILLTACTSLECGPFLPSHTAYVQGVWRVMLLLLMRKFPAPAICAADQMPDWLECVISSLEAIAARAVPEQLLELLTAEAIHYLTRCLPRLHNATLARKIARILVAIGRLNAAEGVSPLQQWMVDAGAIPIMHALIKHVSPRLRCEGIMWLGNLASESSAFVERIAADGAFDTIARELLHPTSNALIDPCLFAFMSAAERCILDKNQDVLDLRIIQLTACYVDRPGKAIVTLEILTLWRNLMRFLQPSGRARALLEECGAMDMVTKFLGHPDPRIYKLAEEIERQGEAHMMTEDD